MMHTITLPGGNRVAFSLHDIAAIMEQEPQPAQESPTEPPKMVRFTTVFLRNGTNWSVRDEQCKLLDELLAAQRGWPVDHEEAA